VIASRIGALPELIADGATGLLFPAGDADALRGKIDWVIAHPAERAAMGARARATVCADHDPAAYLSTLLDIYADARASS
jgi:glycosyltransferase involved in cell wall biosynthesis